jgi:hypothetical protein
VGNHGGKRTGQGVIKPVYLLQSVNSHVILASRRTSNGIRRSGLSMPNLVMASSYEMRGKGGIM